ncbi:MAG: Na+/H+ antiporter subunit E [Synergistaceae bacterium]|nr:Na+/H+ antiporter subunit E [Synergistaceae bacterium]
MKVSPIKPMVLAVALFLAWMATTGRLDLPFLLTGAVIVAIVVRITWATFFAGAHDFSLRGKPWPKPCIAALLAYPLFFFGELLYATWEVALIALRPYIELNPAIIRVDSRFHNSTALVLLANQITLTPGTLTIDADIPHQGLYIHALDLGKEGIDGVKKQIHKLEQQMEELIR